MIDVLKIYQETLDKDIADKRIQDLYKPKNMKTVQSKLPYSIDARDWAKEWLEVIKKHPTIPNDGEVMITWFANAIMAGYDAAVRRYSKIDKNLPKKNFKN